MARGNTKPTTTPNSAASKPTTTPKAPVSKPTTRKRSASPPLPSGQRKFRRLTLKKRVAVQSASNTPTTTKSSDNKDVKGGNVPQTARQPLAQIDGNVKRLVKRAASKSPQRPAKVAQEANVKQDINIKDKENVKPKENVKTAADTEAQINKHKPTSNQGQSAAEVAYSRVYPHGHELIETSSNDHKCAWYAIIASLTALKDQGSIDVPLPSVEDLDRVLDEDCAEEKQLAIEAFRDPANPNEDMSSAFSVDLAALTIMTWAKVRAIAIQMGFIVNGQKFLVDALDGPLPQVTFFISNNYGETDLPMESRDNHFSGLRPLSDSSSVMFNTDEHSLVEADLESVKSNFNDDDIDDADFVAAHEDLESAECSEGDLDSDDGDVSEEDLDGDEGEAYTSTSSNINLDTLSADEQRAAVEFADESGASKSSQWSIKYRRTLILSVHEKIKKTSSGMSEEQQLCIARLRKIMQSILLRAQEHPDGLHWTFKVFFKCLTQENLSTEFVDICCGLVLPVVLEKFGCDDYSPATLIGIFQELEQNAATQDQGNDSNPKRVAYQLAFFDTVLKTLRNYIGETRACYVRWGMHTQNYKRSKASWYPEARKYPTMAKMVLADLKDVFEELGFFYIFIIRMLEASFSILLRTLPREARTGPGSRFHYCTNAAVAFARAVEEDFQEDGGERSAPLLPSGWNTLEGFNTAWPLLQPIFGMRWHKEEIAIIKDVYNKAKTNDSNLWGKKTQVLEQMRQSLLEWKSKQTNALVRLERSTKAIYKRTLKLKLSFYNLNRTPATDRRCYRCWYVRTGKSRRCDGAQPKCGTCSQLPGLAKATPCGVLMTKAEAIAQMQREDAAAAVERRCSRCWKAPHKCDQAKPTCFACVRYEHVKGPCGPHYTKAEWEAAGRPRTMPATPSLIPAAPVSNTNAANQNGKKPASKAKKPAAKAKKPAAQGKEAKKGSKK
ncbi:hypothetical protein LTR64_000325 [Lithohypha guttulata]|uniref:uncharacterized protein n=1 Tax=Lithohypha guttulata TaxID=1690604 RepID=UPI002DDF0785|nr:hypothetical protein LTR51_007684 [Lithohypha guttulata]